MNDSKTSDVSDRNSKKPILFQMRVFYARFHGQALTLAFMFQLLIIGCAMLIFAIAATKLPTLVTVAILTSFIVLAQFFGNILLIHFTLRPLKIIAKIVDYRSDPTTANLNLDDASFRRFGMSELTDKMNRVLATPIAPRVVDVKTDDDLPRALLDQLPVGVIALDRAGKIVFANNRAPIFGGAVELDFVDPGDSLADFLTFAQKNEIASEKTWLHVQNHPRRNESADADRRIYDVIASYHRDAPDGVEAIVIAIDRTDFYHNDETSQDFISLAAHELRAPITIIRGYLEILGEQLAQPTPEQKKIIDLLTVSAQRLADYVSNILNVSHYDHQHMKLALKEMDVKTIIDDARENMTLRAQTAGRKLQFATSDGLPTVAADRSSISEVMSNLIDNAIKYSPAGGVIEISARRDDDFVDFSVTDHGIGIPSNVAEHLFDKFYRSHRSSGSVGGTGLGLYISRAIVESHGGHIAAQSVEGRGSTFTFELPTFASVADKITHGNELLIQQAEPRINNHGLTES